MHSPFQRLLELPRRSFFLFGPRGVGKSFWLRQQLRHAKVFDLLNTATQLELARDPHLLEAKIGTVPQNGWVWIDEVQRVPALLDEVHRLMETKQLRFALSGSSARKLRRHGVNLLAGRASVKHMEPFCSHELGAAFQLREALEWGSLPLVVQDPASARDILAAYVHTYIREEIREEGLIRKTEPFLRFLEIAGLLNGQVLNTENIAREAAVPRKSVVSYFEILEDTLMGFRLPAWQPHVKVREQNHPKFYWFDPGVARGAAGRLFEPVDNIWLGQALETLLFHELRVYNYTAKKERPIRYYRTGAGAEVDFIVELERGGIGHTPRVLCIEAKLSKKWSRAWEAPMRELQRSQKVRVAGMYGVYMGEETYTFDEVRVLPVEKFLAALNAGKVF